MSCPRSITFVIPGKLGIGVQITATENAGNLDFTVDVLGSSKHSADLRGLFFQFNESDLSGLRVLGGDGLITGTQIQANSVINLGQGVNMNGAANPFDVGIAFGSPGKGQDLINGPIHFTLDATQNLTLDDIAHLQFGARLTSVGDKITTIAPAAPDAHDDAFNIFEDGASGLNNPSKIPTPLVFNVLANDTDADNDALVVTGFDGGPSHGTATISADGHNVIYTPNLDYSGPDSFEYCISDGHGGQDHAVVNVNVAAVADAPTLTYQVHAGATVNQILIDVTATQNDADSSEFIDQLFASVAGGLPAGVTVTPGSINPGTEPDQIVQQFVVTLPLDTDTNFNLDITAISKEVSNGDTQTATVTIPIVNDFNSTTTPVQFTADNQSIWNTGDQFTFQDDRFIGINTGPFDEHVGSTFFAGIDGHIQLGFQSTLNFEGGEIDATSNYDVTVETNYNKTVDELLIDTGSLLTAASFSTEGPQGTYMLNFLYDVLLHAFAGVDVDLGPLGSVGGQIDVGPVSVGPGSFNILDLNSDSLGGTIDLPPPLDAFSVNFAWPNITTNGTFPPNPVTSSGASNNFLELNLDLDQLVSQLLFGGVNPLDPPRIDLGPIFVDFDLLDVDITGGLNFLQDFAMQMGDLTGILHFENGSSQSFTIGDSLLIDHASAIDAGGDGDGLVEFDFTLVPTATLHNETDLGMNIGASVSVLSVEVGYDIGVASDSTTIGPLASFGGTAPVGSINVFDDTFDLHFAQQHAFFLA